MFLNPGAYVVLDAPVSVSTDDSGGARVIYPAGQPIPWEEAVALGVVPDRQTLYGEDAGGGDEHGATPPPAPKPKNAQPGRQTRPATSPAKRKAQ